MHKMTILLPDPLYRSAGKEARALGVSLGELIRQRLANPSTETGQTKAFFIRKPWAGDARRDLSAEHDRHLYGS